MSLSNKSTVLKGMGKRFTVKGSVSLRFLRRNLHRLQRVHVDVDSDGRCIIFRSTGPVIAAAVKKMLAIWAELYRRHGGFSFQ